MRRFANGSETYDPIPLCAPSSRPSHCEMIYRTRKLSLLEMPGRTTKRHRWGAGAEMANVLVYLIDSTDEMRLELARHEFSILLDEHKGSRKISMELNTFLFRENESNEYETNM
uniref:Uncharacterized protein n=1 Tax=Lotharella globosa TaxID=91324 RepID=A0A7S3Z0L8_9EUKA